MAAPTAIPHHEASSHHHGRSGSVSNGVPSDGQPIPPFSRSPTGTSPKSMVSPIYTQAGRSAFSMPGPNSTSTSPTTTTWYSAGFASGNSQRVRSPTGPLTGTSNNGAVGPVSSAVSPQRDQFPDAKHPSHFRTASFGSASSSLSSADLRDEPLTPRGGPPNVDNVTAMPLGRTGSIPLGTSYEQIKSRRDSWSFANAAGNRWSGLQSLRERTATGGNGGTTVSSGGVTMPSYLNETKPISSAGAMMNDSTSPTASNGPMGGLLRKFSLSGGQPLKSPPSIGNGNGMLQKSEPLAATSPSMTVTSANGVASDVNAKDDYFKTVPTTRGRQNSNSNSQRRRPSPMGERLLMGHFNAH